MKIREQRRQENLARLSEMHPGVPLVLAGFVLLAFALLGLALLLGAQLVLNPFVVFVLVADAAIFIALIKAHLWLRERRRERDA